MRGRTWHHPAMRRHGWIVLVLALFAAWSWWRSAPPVADAPAPPVEQRPTTQTRTGDAANQPGLPREANDVLRRIRAGGPFRYRQDGGTFQNREGLLPNRPRGYYREYTVDTPGERDRGARRIVTGGEPPTEFFYTQDHYRSFRRIDAALAAAQGQLQ